MWETTNLKKLLLSDFTFNTVPLFILFREVSHSIIMAGFQYSDYCSSVLSRTSPLSAMVLGDCD